MFVYIHIYNYVGRSKSHKASLSTSEVAQSNKEKFLKYLDDPKHTKYVLMRLLRMTRMRGQPLPPPGTRITCFTSTKLQILQARSIRANACPPYASACTRKILPRPGSQFTCFTSTKLHILTLEELRSRRALSVYLLYSYKSTNSDT